MTAAPPDSLARVLVDLGAAAVELATHPTDAARLRHRPASLAPDLTARLVEHKAAILALLADGYTPADGDAAHTFHERLGVADDLHMATHAGSPAWLIAVGESLECSCTMRTNGV